MVDFRLVESSKITPALAEEAAQLALASFGLITTLPAAVQDLQQPALAYFACGWRRQKCDSGTKASKGRLVAFAAIDTVAPGVFVLKALSVASDVRRQGIASGLLAEVARVGLATALHVLQDDDHDALVAWYLKRGYHRCSTECKWVTDGLLPWHFPTETLLISDALVEKMHAHNDTHNDAHCDTQSDTKDAC